MKTPADAGNGQAVRILAPPALRLWAAAVLLFSGVCSPASSSENTAGSDGDYVARVWQWEDGLPANSVLSVAQTPDGFLWVTTAGGLARFDGVRFAAFLPRNILGSSSRFVRAQFVDRRGWWWLASDRAFVAFEDPDTVRVYNAEEALPPRSLIGIAEDRTGRVWFSYRDGRLACISDGKARIVAPQLQPSGDTGLQIASDSEGRVWCARDRTVGILEGESVREVFTLQEPIHYLGYRRRQRVVISAT